MVSQIPRYFRPTKRAVSSDSVRSQDRDYTGLELEPVEDCGAHTSLPYQRKFLQGGTVTLFGYIQGVAAAMALYPKRVVGVDLCCVLLLCP